VPLSPLLRYGWSCITFQTAPTSMSYLYEVFEHLQLMGIDIWMHTHTVTTTDFVPRFGRVGWNPRWCKSANHTTYSWGCRTFQTAHHIHVIPIWGVWAPSTVVYRHMDAHSHCYHNRCFSRFGKLVEILGDARVQTIPLRNGWG
jgi:hypothetical protein